MAQNEDALSRRLNALSGGAPLPQAATMAIARRLLGPGLADRYGDVIGARPSTLADTARDFAVGFISGDPTKADALKMRVMENYREELRREEDQARQREEDARKTVNDFFQLLTQGKKVPKELRKDFFKESLPKIGVEPTSPLFLKILSDTDKFGDIYDALADPEMQRLADEDPLTAVERLIGMGHDGAEALKVAQSVQQMKRYRAETQKLIAEAGAAARRGIQSDADKVKNIRAAAENELQRRAEGTATADAPAFAMFRGLSDDEVQQHALAGGAPRKSTTNPFLQAIYDEMKGLGGEKAPSEAPKVTVRRKGIAQAGGPAAPAAPAAPLAGITQSPSLTPTTVAPAATVTPTTR